MSSLPVATRASFLAQTDRMGTVQARIDQLQVQVSTGKKINAPDDDPVGAARVQQLQRTMDDNAQFGRNMDALNAKLTIADGAVQGIANNLTRVRELVLSAANGTMTAGDRKNVAAELDQLTADMLTLANTRDAGGDYVFAGTKATAPAYGPDPVTGLTVYQGGAAVASVPTGPDTKVRAGETGAAVLTAPGAATDVFGLLAEFKDLLAAPSPLGSADQTRYAALLDNLQGSIGHVNDVRASLGGRLSTIETEQARLKDLATTLTTNKSALESADVAAVISEMQSAMLILQASRQTFGQIGSLSLFNYIK